MVGEWLPGLYGYFRRLGVSAVAAEDLAQDTFLIAWRKLPSLRKPEQMRSWLYGTAYRRYLNHRRKQLSEADLRSVAAAPLVADDPGSDRRLDLQSVRRAVVALSDEYRQPLALIYWQELSYEEAARVLGIPLGTLAWRVRRALGLVREALTKEETAGDRQRDRGGSRDGKSDPVGDA